MASFYNHLQGRKYLSKAWWASGIMIYGAFYSTKTWVGNFLTLLTRHLRS